MMERTTNLQSESGEQVEVMVPDIARIIELARQQREQEGRRLFAQRQLEKDLRKLTYRMQDSLYDRNPFTRERATELVQVSLRFLRLNGATEEQIEAAIAKGQAA